MKFLRSFANFLSALAFLCCHHVFDSYLSAWLLAWIFILIFDAYIVLNIQIQIKLDHIQIYFIPIYMLFRD